MRENIIVSSSLVSTDLILSRDKGSPASKLDCILDALVGLKLKLYGIGPGGERNLRD